MIDYMFAWYNKLSVLQKMNLSSFWAMFYIVLIAVLYFSGVNIIKKDIHEILIKEIEVSSHSNTIGFNLLKMRQLEKKLYFHEKSTEKLKEDLLNAQIQIENAVQNTSDYINTDEIEKWKSYVLKIKLLTQLYEEIIAASSKHSRKDMIEKNRSLVNTYTNEIISLNLYFKSYFEKRFSLSHEKIHTKLEQISLYMLILVAFVIGIFSFFIFITHMHMKGKIKRIFEKIEILKSGKYHLLSDELMETSLSKDEFEQIANSLKEAILKLKEHEIDQNLYKVYRDSRLRLASMVNKERTLDSLLTKSLYLICRDLHVSCGCIYMVASNQEKLILEAQFAPQSTHAFKKELEFGEDLVGQVAIEKEAYTVCNLMKDKTLQHEYAFVLEYGDNVLGVVYLAKFSEFDLACEEHLKAVGDILSANIHASIESQKSLELLHKTTQQAKELEKTSNIKSEFISNMSHELRTPLNAINTLSFMMKRNKETNLSIKQIEQLATINKAGNDLLHLINDILDYSKLEAHKMQIKNGRVFIKEIVSTLHAYFKHQAIERRVEFDYTVDEDLPKSFNTDVQKVEQILKNYLSNAFKFTEFGGSITLSASMDMKSESVCFSVKDSGIGIKEDKLANIFDPFVQAEENSSIKGTGLGLSIVKEMAILLGGRVFAESIHGKGSTFYLYLPLQQDNVQYQHSKHVHKDTNKSKFAKVLFVGNQLAKITKWIKKAKEEYNLEGVFAVDMKEAAQMQDELDLVATIQINDEIDDKKIHELLTKIHGDTNA